MPFKKDEPVPPVAVPPADDRVDALEKRVAKLEREAKKDRDATAMIRGESE